ncbi:hypothetical protein HK099_002607 [Clydaea vesicula]|uniref:USP domain-containing protein n=1 Tax=Clydaea vesicula TaxID=447962 RepID=A0AAD5Y1A6_9FUNG|nr:hypothetical protein HK099_002607 [Clydaea vesicula]
MQQVSTIESTYLEKIEDLNLRSLISDVLTCKPNKLFKIVCSFFQNSNNITFNSFNEILKVLCLKTTNTSKQFWIWYLQKLTEFTKSRSDLDFSVIKFEVIQSLVRRLDSLTMTENNSICEKEEQLEESDDEASSEKTVDLVIDESEMDCELLFDLNNPINLEKFDLRLYNLEFSKSILVLLFNSTSMDKRIFSLNIFKDILRKWVPFETNENDEVFSNNELERNLVQWIKENKFIEKIFGSSFHLEIAQRSLEMLLFLNRFNEFKISDFDLIWGWVMSNQHQTVVHGIFSIIQGLIRELNFDLLEICTSKMISLYNSDKALIDLQFANLIKECLLRIRSLSTLNSECQMRSKKLTDTLVLFCFEMTSDESDLSLALITEFLQLTISLLYNGIGDLSLREEIASIFLKRMRKHSSFHFKFSELLFNCIYQNFGNLRVEDLILQGKLPHYSQIWNRLAFIHSTIIKFQELEKDQKKMELLKVDGLEADQCPMTVVRFKFEFFRSKEDCFILWDEIISNSLCVSELEIGYNIFWYLASVSNLFLESIYLERVLFLKDFKTILGYSFKFFNQCFLHIGESTNSIRVVDNEIVEVFDDSISVDLFWDIALNALNESVGESAIHFLLKFYQSTIDSEKSDTYLVNRCLNEISDAFFKNSESYDQIKFARSLKILKDHLTYYILKNPTSIVSHDHNIKNAKNLKINFCFEDVPYTIDISELSLLKSFKKKVHGLLNLSSNQDLRVIYAGKELCFEQKSLKELNVGNNVLIAVRELADDAESPGLVVPEIKDDVECSDNITFLPTIAEEKNFMRLYNLLSLPEIQACMSQKAVQLPKCKLSTSREAAFCLLQELSFKNESNFLFVTKLLYEQIPEGISNWSNSPDSLTKANCGFVGLENLGATCYLNSIMQQFFMNIDFRKNILSVVIPESERNDNLLYELQRLFVNLQESEKKYYEPTTLCNAYTGYDGERLNVKEQTDVDEFFNIFFLRLEDLLKGKNDKENLLKLNYGGKLLQRITSKECPHFSESFESFFALQCEVKNKRNLLESLQLYVEKETLDRVHLKRFDYDQDSMRRIKLNDKFEFPEVLDMFPYTAEGVDHSENNFITSKRCLYELSGVLIHSGSSESGHYYSYVKDKEYTDRWIAFNDSNVSTFNSNLISQKCFGGFEEFWDEFKKKSLLKPKIYSAYMLFYDCVDKQVIEHDNVIPLELFKSVWKENQMFLNEKNLFDDSFSNFLTQIILENPNSVTENLFEHTILLGTKYFLRIVLHSQNGGNLNILEKWIQFLTPQYKSCFEATHRTGSSLSVAAKNLINLFINPDILEEFLLDCHSTNSRLAFNLLIAKIFEPFRKFHPAEYGILILDEMKTETEDKANKKVTIRDDSPIASLLNSLISLLPKALNKKKQFTQYFALLHYFATSSLEVSTFMIEHGYVKSLFEFYMEDRTKLDDYIYSISKCNENYLPLIEVLDFLLGKCSMEVNSTEDDMAMGSSTLLILNSNEKEVILHEAESFISKIIIDRIDKKLTHSLISKLCRNNLNVSNLAIGFLLDELVHSEDDDFEEDSMKNILTEAIHYILCLSDNLKSIKFEFLIKKHFLLIMNSIENPEESDIISKDLLNFFYSCYKLNSLNLLFKKALKATVFAKFILRQIFNADLVARQQSESIILEVVIESLKANGCSSAFSVMIFENLLEFLPEINVLVHEGYQDNIDNRIQSQCYHRIYHYFNLLYLFVKHDSVFGELIGKNFEVLYNILHMSISVGFVDDKNITNILKIIDLATHKSKIVVEALISNVAFNRFFSNQIFILNYSIPRDLLAYLSIVSKCCDFNDEFFGVVQEPQHFFHKFSNLALVNEKKSKLNEILDEKEKCIVKDRLWGFLMKCQCYELHANLNFFKLFLEKFLKVYEKVDYDTIKRGCNFLLGCKISESETEILFDLGLFNTVVESILSTSKNELQKNLDLLTILKKFFSLKHIKWEKVDTMLFLTSDFITLVDRILLFVNQTAHPSLISICIELLEILIQKNHTKAFLSHVLEKFFVNFKNFKNFGGGNEEATISKFFLGKHSIYLESSALLKIFNSNHPTTVEEGPNIHISEKVYELCSKDLKKILIRKIFQPYFNLMLNLCTTVFNEFDSNTVILLNNMLLSEGILLSCSQPVNFINLVLEKPLTSKCVSTLFEDENLLDIIPALTTKFLLNFNRSEFSLLFLKIFPHLKEQNYDFLPILKKLDTNLFEFWCQIEIEIKNGKHLKEKLEKFEISLFVFSALKKEFTFSDVTLTKLDSMKKILMEKGDNPNCNEIISKSLNWFKSYDL